MQWSVAGENIESKPWGVLKSNAHWRRLTSPPSWENRKVVHKYRPFPAERGCGRGTTHSAKGQLLCILLMSHFSWRKLRKLSANNTVCIFFFLEDFLIKGLTGKNHINLFCNIITMNRYNKYNMWCKNVHKRIIWYGSHFIFFQSNSVNLHAAYNSWWFNHLYPPRFRTSSDSGEESDELKAITANRVLISETLYSGIVNNPVFSVCVSSWKKKTSLNQWEHI